MTDLSAPRPAPGEDRLAEAIMDAAELLPAPEAPDFAEPFARFADARVVLLGEATHGTAEFYRARAAITRALVERHGFTAIAVEADWPDAAWVDRAIRGRPHPEGMEAPFQRFPTWMWRNAEVVALLQWARAYNAGAREPVGFYGLDLYNLGASMSAVVRYLDRVDPEAAAVARERYGCLAPWREEPADYGRAVLGEGYRTCEEAVVAQCRQLLEGAFAHSGQDGADYLDAAGSARLVASAERYYRVMYQGGAASWNLRDRHMAEALEQILEARGPDAKAVVWAHNSHIGDARHTTMGRRLDEISLGQLCRERFGDEAALIGFGTDRGTVAAASDWDGPMEIKRVRPSRPDSYERLCRDTGLPRFLLDLRADGAARRGLAEPRLERFIGVIYRPETERQSHYMEAVLPEQFDAWVWFDETEAVTPLAAEPQNRGAAETLPFGL